MFHAVIFWVRMGKTTSNLMSVRVSVEIRSAHVWNISGKYLLGRKSMHSEEKTPLVSLSLSLKRRVWINTDRSTQTYKHTLRGGSRECVNNIVTYSKVFCLFTSFKYSETFIDGSLVHHIKKMQHWEQQKRIPEVSYTALKARRKKISARRLLLHKQYSYIYLK
jgi:hypothetical protein